MAVRRWLKGNTHTHTNYSDGDSAPEVVVDWYADHGYDFLFLTDHNALIPHDHLARLQRRGLAVWQGEEITMAAVHVNGLGLDQIITPAQPTESDREHLVELGRAERVRWAVEQVHAQHGVASVNHPNFLWALGADDLLGGGDFDLLEVANGHHGAENRGDAEHPSSDELWDSVLVAGRQVWGVASDDAHHFTRWGPGWANPGRGWLEVEGESPRIHDCLEALRQGRFYASTGLELLDYRATTRDVAVELAGPARIELVGAGSRVLDVVDGTRASFSLASVDSPYVRLRAGEWGTGKLWTQPIFL